MASLCHEGRVSVACFLGTLGIVFGLSLSQYWFECVPQVPGALLWGPLLYYFLMNISMRMYFKDADYQIALRATFLGFVLAVGLIVFLFGSSSVRPFGAYAAAMSLFHYTEYLSIAYTNPGELKLDSFMLNHSLAYGLAAVSSWLEYAGEWWLWPQLKTSAWTLWLGLALTLTGELLRKLAIVTAHSNFNHVVQFKKAADHRLVTHGVYACCRHPSYVGWFWWSIGTQIVLANPVCTLVYTAVSWKFFKDRIYVEEITLLNFFGREYVDYQRDVGTGLPGIRGYVVEAAGL